MQQYRDRARLGLHAVRPCMGKMPTPLLATEHIDHPAVSRLALTHPNSYFFLPFFFFFLSPSSSLLLLLLPPHQSGSSSVFTESSSLQLYFPISKFCREAEL